MNKREDWIHERPLEIHGPTWAELHEAGVEAAAAPLREQLDALIDRYPRPIRAWIRWRGRRAYLAAKRRRVTS